MTAKRREAMAAPDTKINAPIRKREEMFATVDGERPEGKEYATGIVETELVVAFVVVAECDVDVDEFRRDRIPLPKRESA